MWLVASVSDSAALICTRSSLATDGLNDQILGSIAPPSLISNSKIQKALKTKIRFVLFLVIHLVAKPEMKSREAVYSLYLSHLVGMFVSFAAKIFTCLILGELPQNSLVV